MKQKGFNNSEAIAYALKKTIEKIASPDNPEAWRTGDLTYKLRQIQKVIFEEVSKSTALKYVVNCSRRIGKSYLACVIANQYALKIPNSIIRFAAPTQKEMRNIIHPTMRVIMRDCPVAMRPRWNSLDGVYKYSNGSVLQPSGCNMGRADDLRGEGANLIIVEEAGFIDDLDYVVSDILMPQLLTTGGRMVIISTPPKTPDHPFTRIAQEAMASGNYSKHDIYESGYPTDIIERFKEEAGGEKSTTWRREYLCEFVVDSKYQIVPEWQDRYIQDVPRDEYFNFYHRYNAMDLGVRDLNVNLFAYYDFKKARIVVEDEIVINGPEMTTEVIASLVKEKENKLWGSLPVYKRVADNNNPLMLQDMSALHGIAFMPTSKDTLEAMVNHLRLLVGAGRVIVLPGVKHLIGCLQYGIWKEARDDFARSSVYGHYDALAALIYLARNIDFFTNPIPATYSLDRSTHFIPKDYGKDQPANELLKLF